MWQMHCTGTVMAELNRFQGHNQLLERVGSLSNKRKSSRCILGWVARWLQGDHSFSSAETWSIVRPAVELMSVSHTMRILSRMSLAHPGRFATRGLHQSDHFSAQREQLSGTRRVVSVVQ